jgi:nicotinamidase-related amidase/uncharacterized protein YbjT (DUF2867 family)
MIDIDVPELAEGHRGPGRAGPWLVFGASGYIGGYLVPHLVAAGLRVRAAARSPEDLEGRGWGGVELVRADALEPESLTDALANVEVAYYLVHSMSAGKGFGAIDLEAARNFARAADAAGVRRIVYLGGLLPEDTESEHLRSRADTGNVLRQGAVPVTELRAGIIVGPGSAAFEVIRDLVNNLPVMVTPRWVRSKAPPIALEDLLGYLRRVPLLEETAGGIYDVAGPEMLSYEDLMRQYGEIVGRHPRIIPVPVLTPGLSSYWLGLVTAVPTPVARALIAGLGHDIPADPEPLRRLIPGPLLTFRESVERTLEIERRHAVASRWVEGVLMFRGYRQDYAYYAKRHGGSAHAAAPVEDVWRVVQTIGGDTGYFFMNGAWRLRGLVDWALGGTGLSRGRRDPERLRVGDFVDSWQVVAMEPPQRLTLGFGMKAPGSGVMEFEIRPEGSGSRITVTAYWHPAGIWGLAYWYAHAPMHGVIFGGMARGIARRAVELAHDRRSLHRVSDGGLEMTAGMDETDPRPGGALLVVDVQNDFLPGGALGVADGDAVIAVANRYMARYSAAGLPVFLSRDWHPPEHCSFEAAGGPWPPHCVQDTPGSAFPESLRVPEDAVVISKATRADADAYSAFEGTDLAARLERAGVRRLLILGLATDYCVQASVRDALAAGFEVTVPTTGVRAVDASPGDGDRALAAMREAGARLLPG